MYVGTSNLEGKVGDAWLYVMQKIIYICFYGLDACEGTGVSTSPLIFEEHMLEKLDVITEDKHDRLNLSRGMNG